MLNGHCDDEPEEPPTSATREVVVAVLIAALGAALTRAGEWAVDELRHRYGSKPPPAPPPPAPAPPP